MKEKITGIYCIENTINHKKYIGMSRDINRRWSEHKAELNTCTHDNQYLQNSWDKYGKEKFIFHIIELCNEDKLSERERYYIKFYNSLYREDGYNLTPGGENTSIGKEVICLKNSKIYNYVSEAAKDANVCGATMSSWCKQKHNYMYLKEYEKLSDEEKTYWCNFDWEKYDHNKLSNAHKRENLSEETLRKASMSLSGANNPRARKVYCPQLNETFNCIKDASDKYNINRGSISSHLKGNLKSAGKHPITGEKLTWELIGK